VASLWVDGVGVKTALHQGLNAAGVVSLDGFEEVIVGTCGCRVKPNKNKAYKHQLKVVYEEFHGVKKKI
jgi:hypothetical protein